MTITVLKPGLQTTVQDLGRYGYQMQGVVVGGAMDKMALRMANLLVGNDEAAAVLELSMQGPELQFEQDTLIALAGADLTASINDKQLRLWRPVLVKAGSILRFGKPAYGNYTYLAVAGGINVPEVMGSRSTYLRASIGGLEGRSLRRGDSLNFFESSETSKLLLSELLLQHKAESAFTEVNWWPEPELLPTYAHDPVLRAMPGLEYAWFSENSRDYIWEQKYKLTPQSDRMGYRLQGTTLALEEERQLLSTAVSFGTVQVPPQGDPIILMADSQTTGGYPRILQIISADLPKLAQVQPGGIIRFEEVSLEEAHRLYYQQEKQLLALQQAIIYKLHQG
ncbi:biotin-dependent carboxyltransferase family protein [Pontibacter anaerobius]|uniref:Biotin-dependent carboxyltransferase family protein n=1 Tax=Pontibacter anaerobius TaxID=2993940 RepID=A0ABT3RFJ1_9BACT|nr:biotin-dependent carboxyltransferase family protein [Pontibacter anaerobius]MCX2740367.1 biotin-dependent carboxyltransferase family protein [Pontibacter anaerobius]